MGYPRDITLRRANFKDRIKNDDNDDDQGDSDEDDCVMALSKDTDN